MTRSLNLGELPLEKYQSFFQVYVLIGLPGTGKTTLANMLYKEANRISQGGAVLVNRDALRCDALWETRKMPEDAKSWALAHMDIVVDAKEESECQAALWKEANKRILILDGCHTNLKSLLKLIGWIRLQASMNAIGRIKIYPIFVGDENSECMHTLTDKQEGDYSDFTDTKGTHSSLPRQVFEKKREELHQLHIAENWGLFMDITDKYIEVK